MPLGKPKLKTAIMNLRVEPRIKFAAEEAARQARRSVTSLIEILVLEYCDKSGIETVEIKSLEKDNE